MEDLLFNYLQGELDQAGQEELRRWVNASEKNKALFDQLTNPASLEKKLQAFHTIDGSKEAARKKLVIAFNDNGATVQKMIKRIAVAASILLVVGLGSYFLFLPKKEYVIPLTADTKDIIAPATNRATIRLTDGRTVYLDSAANGELVQQGNIKLVKLANGQIAYQTASDETVKEIQYNTLSNPRGSKVIDMTLADGSRVWLNAGSSVTYPVAFISNERKVSITGEAYFEVAHDARKPFFVTKRI